MERELIVRGEAVMHVWPDRAALRVTVEGDAADRDGAYAAAAAVATKVDRVISEYRDSVGRSSTTALVVQPKQRWKNGEMKHAGWRAARTSTLEVTTFDRLGDLIAAVTQCGGAVGDLSFTVDNEHAAFGELRRAATANARRKADDYAAGLGLRVVAVAGATEPEVMSVIPAARGMLMSGYGKGGVEPPAIIEVNPEAVAITAAIEVRFTFEPLA